MGHIRLLIRSVHSLVTHTCLDTHGDIQNKLNTTTHRPPRYIKIHVRCQLESIECDLDVGEVVYVVSGGDELRQSVSCVKKSMTEWQS